MLLESFNRDFKTCALLVRNNTSVEQTAMQILLERSRLRRLREESIMKTSAGHSKRFPLGFVDVSVLRMTHGKVAPGSFLFVRGTLHRVCGIGYNAAQTETRAVLTRYRRVSEGSWNTWAKEADGESEPFGAVERAGCQPCVALPVDLDSPDTVFVGFC
jgi:hypothetical protein